MIDRRSIVYIAENAALATPTVCGAALLGRLTTGNWIQAIAITALGLGALIAYLLMRQRRIAAHGNPRNGGNYRIATILITCAVYATFRAVLYWNDNHILEASTYGVITIACCTTALSCFLWNRDWRLGWPPPSCTHCQLPFTEERPRIEWTLDLPGPGSQIFKSTNVCRPCSITLILAWVQPAP